MHDVLTIGVPLVAILAGVLFNEQDVISLRSDIRSEISTLRSDMNKRFDSIDSRFDTIQRDMRDFLWRPGPPRHSNYEARAT
jgi:hypothetical protein